MCPVCVRGSVIFRCRLHIRILHPAPLPLRRGCRDWACHWLFSGDSFWMKLRRGNEHMTCAVPALKFVWQVNPKMPVSIEDRLQVRLQEGIKPNWLHQSKEKPAGHVAVGLLPIVSPQTWTLDGCHLVVAWRRCRPMFLVAGEAHRPNGRTAWCHFSILQRTDTPRADASLPVYRAVVYQLVM